MSKILTLTKRTLDFFRKNPGKWINGGEIERIFLKNGHKGSTGSRICRQLAEDGDLLREIRKEPSRSVWYSYNNNKPKTTLNFENIWDKK